jgi:adenine phosphoribosyltransferase
MTLEEQIRSAVTVVPDFPKQGVQYKDITTLFLDPGVCKSVMNSLVAQYRDQRIGAIIGLESRGFMFGFALSLELNVPFIMVRKKGKLPRETYEVSYDLEYGESVIEMHRDALREGQRVLIHDDLLATGGTAEAAARLVKASGAELAGFSFLIELSYLNGRKKLTSYSDAISTFVTY